MTWILDYLPRRNIELRLVVDDSNDRAYEFRHALSLGQPPGRLQAAAPPRRDIPVASVAFIGDIDLPETDLQNRLRLRVGDQFDFYRWQQDRDELERFYADRGFLESRVRPQRVETADGTIGLSYEIDRGPLSILTIEGYDLSDDVVETMRDTWNRAVFDGFLLDELRILARERLADDGFLRAEIDAHVLDEDDDRKEIVLRIAAGPQTSERRIAFRGNQRLTTTVLESFVRVQGTDQTAWTDPTELTRSLLALYQSEGMLEAEVALNPPEFDASTASLQIEIAEGPVFTISSLSVVGVATRTTEAINALIGPQAGDIYSGLRVSDARARVDQDYRQAGFNQVRVSIRSTVDQVSDTVAVALEVEEGPRQVVQEIEVTGGDRTHSGLVSRALQLSPGQAVDLGEWNRARKRLYDTGAFRSVDIEAEPLDGVIEPVPGEQPVRARVRLEEWPAYRLRYGLQLKDEEVPLGEQSEQTLNAGFVGDLTRQNFAGRAVTLGTAFRWDTDQRVVRGFGRIPSFFGLPITLSLFVAQEHETSVETFDDIDFFTVADVTGLTLEQRVRPRPALTFAYSYSLERNHSFDPNARSNDPFAFDIIRRIARLAGTVIIDTRDDVFDASRGWFHSSSLEYAPESLGSQFRFTKYSVQQFHYWPIGREIVVATAARAALAQAFGQDLDLRERFFAGDGNTVRGYRQDSLGPLFRGQPDGGNALVVLNQEVRFPIFGITRGVGFVDAGNVFPLLENFDITDLKVGAGIGLRLATPFGLFRFDFATPLSKIEDERRSRFFFSIGQIF